VLSTSAANMAVSMLRQVVTRGTGRTAEIEGFEIAGKTGTADKPRPSGGYYRDRNVATFASVFPASNPQYVMIVTMDEPSVQGLSGESRTAGATAVPVAAELLRRLAPLIGLEPKVDEILPTITPRFQPRVEPPASDEIKLVANQ